MPGLAPAIIPCPVLNLPPEPITMRLPVLAWNALLVTAPRQRGDARAGTRLHPLTQVDRPCRARY
jgi:hypothetical protein